MDHLYIELLLDLLSQIPTRSVLGLAEYFTVLFIFFLEGGSC